MIELNFCNLNFNLKRKIIERGENDYFKTFMPDAIPLQEKFSDDDDSDDENA